MISDFGFRLIFSLTVLWLTTGIGICLYRRSSAAVRHRIWGLSMVAALVLPLVLFVLPTVRLGWFEAPPNIMAFESPIPVLGNQSSRFERSDITNTPPPSPTKVSVAVETPDGVAVVRKAPAAVYRLWLLWIIAAPCLWGLSTLTRSLLASQRILAESAVVNDTSCCQMSAALARAIHLRAIVQLRQSSRIHVPVCTGWWTPQIVLPSWWRTWSQETLRAVIAHELSHAARCDVAWQLIARLACSLMWFHPLAWLVAWRMRVEREFACDDSVLQLGESPTTYARCLVDIADKGVPSVPAFGAAMTVRSGLEYRVRAILDPRRSRHRVGTATGRFLIVAALIALLVASGVSPLSYRTVADKPTLTESDAEQSVDGNSIWRHEGWRLHSLIHPAHRQMIWSATFSPDGKSIATAGADKTVAIWNVDTGKLVTRIERPVNCTDVAFSKKGELLAIAGGDGGEQPPGELLIWDLQKGNVHTVLQSHETTRYVKCVAFSADGTTLASGGIDHSVRLWNPISGKLKFELHGHKGLVHSVAFSPDGRILASGSFDTTIILWDVAAGTELATLRGHAKEVRGLVFSPDGTQLVSTSEDETARVWNVAEQSEVGIMKGHNSQVFSAAFHPGGQCVATGSQRKVYLWDVNSCSWQDHDVFPLQSTEVMSLAFSTDGKMLAIVGGWNSLQIWKRTGDAP